MSTQTGNADFLGGGGETGALIRAFPWENTSLGSLPAWSASLKTAAALILHSPVPIVTLLGEDGVLLYNDAYSRFAGARHPHILGAKVADAWPEVAEFNANVLRVCLAGGTLAFQDQELTLYRNGVAEQVWLNLDYSPIPDELGRPVGVVAVVVETTQRVLADRRMLADHERLRSMFDQAPGFIALLEGPNHVFTLANAAYQRLVGTRRLLGMPVREALPEIVGQGYVDLLDRCFASGESLIGKAQMVQLRRRSGEVDTRYVDFVYQPIQDNNGETAGLFIQGSDVTEHKQAEIALQALNASLEQRVAERTTELRDIQTFYVHSSECHALLRLRDDGEFVYDEINPATLHLYGTTRERVIGRTTTEVLGTDSAAHVNANLRSAVELATPQTYVRTQNGSSIEAVVTPIPVASGEPRRLAVTARDVTEQKHLEEQLRQAQKMEAVGQLTGGLAHDFNNLLGAISGSLELLGTSQDQGRTQDSERYRNMALSASRRAASLTHRLLAFSRRQTLDAKAVNINRLIGGMAELIRRTVGPEIEVEAVNASDLWLTFADVGQLENSLLNLCINARDAMPDGGRITIETCNRWIDVRTAGKHDLVAGQYVSMCVSDIGSGMTADVAARACDPFFTTKPTGAGTGLGLSMVYGFAKQSGGQIRIYSEPGQGTMVCVYLPRLKGGSETDDTEPPQIALRRPHSGAGKILVVDDEANLRIIMADVLAGLGLDVVEAHDGVSALKVLDSDEPLDLLITDVGLPGGMNGRQIADAAKVRRPGLKVLFVTGYAENAAIGNGFVGEGMQVLTKPFSIDEFILRVQTFVLAGRGEPT
ncbi:MAG: PAS domain-containing protein [Rudaea sp.]